MKSELIKSDPQNEVELLLAERKEIEQKLLNLK